MKLIFEPNSVLRESVLQVVANIRNNEPIVLTTSGTTGIPKEITQQVTLAHRGSPDEVWLLTYSPARWAGVSVISHVVGSGSTLIVPRSLSLKDLAEVSHVTHISLTPSMFRSLVLSGFSPPLQQITFGGEVASQSVLDLAKKSFPQARVTHVYASTEAGDICAVSDGLAGYPQNKFDQYVFDGQELVIGDLHTGDLWELRDGRYHFVGRKEEIINVGGIKVSPHIVEEAVLCCGGKFARAYAVKAPLLGHLVGLDYCGDVDWNLLRHRLSRYEMPSKVTKLEDIPVFEAGKIIRCES